MAAPQLSPEQIFTVLEQTLSPQEGVRKNGEKKFASRLTLPDPFYFPALSPCLSFYILNFVAEQQLEEAQKIDGYPLKVLQIVANANVPNPAVRQAAAVHFKNIVKNGWDEQNKTKDIHISAEDRNTIKSHLVELMCTVPPAIQSQCSESITLIAVRDFPDQWENLMPELVQKFTSTDPAVVNGVLRTANSIFKRFRFAGKSDDLYRVILYALHEIQAPLLTLFLTLGKAIDEFPNDPAQLVPRFEALRLICRIFYSLNFHDLPEFFEDHIDEWMKGFAKYLEYQNPVLVDESEDDQPGPIEKLQAAIIASLDLYGGKDGEYGSSVLLKLFGVRSTKISACPALH
jgi:exportin-2 (importin alpha re-exporter)